MLDQLKIYNVYTTKIRLGNPWDGGYIVPINVIGESEALFTYGIGSDTAFERDYALISRKKAYCFDHTIEEINVSEFYLKYLNFKKEGLSDKTESDKKHFFDHYSEKGMTGKVLLKIDTEGAEYDFFENTDIDELANRVCGMVIEFHFFNRKEILDKFLSLLSKINNRFLICHVHGNNYGGTSDYEYNGQPYIMPHFLEISFVNKNSIEAYGVEKSEFPDQRLDVKNELSKPEHDLAFLKLINI